MGVPVLALDASHPTLKNLPSERKELQPRPVDQVVGYALRIRGARVRCHVGVSEMERADAQELVVAVDVELPGHAWPTRDDLNEAADYSAVVAIANETATERAYQLLETFARRAVLRIGEHFPHAERVRVAVTKAIVPVVPRPDEATVEVVVARRVE